MGAQILRFDQPVTQVPVTTKAHLDALLTMEPREWASDYTGAWLSTRALLVTVVEIPPGSRQDPAYRMGTDVGSLRVSVLAGGGLTSLDGSSTPCNASKAVDSGSWGDVVCNGGLFVHSATVLVVAFSLPATLASTSAPEWYTLLVSTSPTFPPNATSVTTVSATQGASFLFASPTSLAASSLRYLVHSLVPGTVVYARVAASVPTLPAQVSQDLPRAVEGLAWPLGGAGGCSCSSVQAGTGCVDVAGEPGEPQGLAPTGPAIGGCWARVCGGGAG